MKHNATAPEQQGSGFKRLADGYSQAPLCTNDDVASLQRAFKTYISAKPGINVQFEGVQNQESAMPRVAVEDNKRMSLRISPEAKSRIARAAALRHADMTNFVTQAALREADAVIAEAQRIQLSERDHQKILDLIENPPAPNARLRAALAAMPVLK